MDNDERGQELAAALGWDGISILETAIAALSDANFHAEAEILEKMANYLMQTDETPVYTLEIKDKE